MNLGAPTPVGSLSPAWEGALGLREDAITAAHHIVARHRDAAERFVAEQLEAAEARRDGELITRWLLVREAVRDLLRDDPIHD
ncbi:MAG: hypothetical protein JO021_12455 [Alphaproteobacteria bacterium]|nr:hypothetical protein [Alphaproteobacteria bacterium]